MQALLAGEGEDIFGQWDQKPKCMQLSVDSVNNSKAPKHSVVVCTNYW